MASGAVENADAIATDAAVRQRTSNRMRDMRAPATSTPPRRGNASIASRLLPIVNIYILPSKMTVLDPTINSEQMEMYTDVGAYIQLYSGWTQEMEKKTQEMEKKTQERIRDATRGMARANEELQERLHRTEAEISGLRNEIDHLHSGLDDITYLTAREQLAIKCNLPEHSSLGFRVFFQENAIVGRRLELCRLLRENEEYLNAFEVEILMNQLAQDLLVDTSSTIRQCGDTVAHGYFRRAWYEPAVPLLDTTIIPSILLAKTDEYLAEAITEVSSAFHLSFMPVKIGLAYTFSLLWVPAPLTYLEYFIQSYDAPSTAADSFLEARGFFHVVPTGPIEINEPNSLPVEKDAGFSQVAEEVSLHVQVCGSLFKLCTGTGLSGMRPLTGESGDAGIGGAGEGSFSEEPPSSRP
ncbi:hypothetical protein BD779DRAFT_1480173 [Infundibulicybe gibba]|nr:hypothetical protein BD779DRAFT_1480173 [Infundibulicybe gibba]